MEPIKTEYKSIEHDRGVCILRVAEYAGRMISEEDKVKRILINTQLRRELDHLI